MGLPFVLVVLYLIFFLSFAFACTNRFIDEMLKHSFLLNAFWPQYPLLHFVINVGLTFGHQSPF